MVTARRARVTGLSVLLLTFTAGGLVGAATLQMLNADEPPARARPQGNTAAPDFLDRLSLTEAQRTQIDAVLERRRSQMESFWTEHRPALRAIADSARAELRFVLTPEQRALEEQYHAERRQHQEKRERKDYKW